MAHFGLNRSMLKWIFLIESEKLLRYVLKHPLQLMPVPFSLHQLNLVLDTKYIQGAKF